MEKKPQKKAKRKIIPPSLKKLLGIFKTIWNCEKTSKEAREAGENRKESRLSEGKGKPLIVLHTVPMRIEEDEELEEKGQDQKVKEKDEFFGNEEKFAEEMKQWEERKAQFFLNKPDPINEEKADYVIEDSK